MVGTTEKRKTRTTLVVGMPYVALTGARRPLGA